MADSAFLSRLPVRGAVFQSAGTADAFKVPLLDAEGKIHFSLLSNSSGIYTAADTVARLAQGGATPGDFCIQADNNSIYFLKAAPPSDENNWVRLSTVENAQEDFDSPEFTGTPTAPTASITTNSTQLATTAFVKSLAGTQTPQPDSVQGAVGMSLKYALEDHSHPADVTKAPINSPSFTGTPSAPNPDYTENGARLATTQYVKQQSIDGFSPVRGNVDLNGWRITTLGLPINERDAVPKSYVDAMQSGLVIRQPVRVATTENISLTGSVTSVDSVTLVAGDRILVKNQINASQNGIYVVNIGSPWQRAADADSAVEMKNGVYVAVTQGTVGANTAWILVVSGNVVLNSTAINFVYFSNQATSQVAVGYGLSQQDNLISVDSTVVASRAVLEEEIDTLNGALTAEALARTTADAALELAIQGKAALVHNHAISEITGLDNALSGKQPVGNYATSTQGALADSASQPGHTHTTADLTDFSSAFAKVATTGNYNDLTNTPAVPPAQVNSDWSATTGVSQILNKPDLAQVATTGDYNDLTNTPSIAAGITPVANAGINIDIATSAIKTTYNTLIGDGVTSIAVGGASALPASAWKTKNIVEVLDTILFPDVLPTYTVPTISLSGTQSGEKEVGTTISQALTLSGSKNDAGAFTALSLTRGGTSIASTSSPVSSSITNIADQFGYANPNSPNQKYDLTFTDSSVVVVSGANTWAASGTYSAGLAKKNNKGVTDARAAATRSTSAPQLGATFSPSSITVTGIYPYFYGVSAGSPTLASIAALISGGTSTKVLANASGSLSINYTANSQFIWFAHSDAYTTKTKWSEQGSLFNTGAIGNSSSTGFMKYLGTVSVTSPDSVWTTTFKIYCSGNATIVNSVVYVFANS